MGRLICLVLCFSISPILLAEDLHGDSTLDLAVQSPREDEFRQDKWVQDEDGPFEGMRSVTFKAPGGELIVLSPPSNRDVEKAWSKMASGLKGLFHASKGRQLPTKQAVAQQLMDERLKQLQSTGKPRLVPDTLSPEAAPAYSDLLR